MPAHLDVVKHGAHHVALHRAPGLLNGYLPVLLPAGQNPDASLAAIAAHRHVGHQAPEAGCELCQHEQQARHQAAPPVGVEETDGPLTGRVEQRLVGPPEPGPGHRWAIATQRTHDRPRIHLMHPSRVIRGGAGLLDAIWTGCRPARARRNHVPADRQNPVPLTDGFTFLDLHDGEAWSSANWYSLLAAADAEVTYAAAVDGGGLYADTTVTGLSTVLIGDDGTGLYYDTTGAAGLSLLVGLDGGGARAWVDDDLLSEPLVSSLVGVDVTGPYYDLAGAADVSVLSVELGQPTFTY